jgi:peptide deformylase
MILEFNQISNPEERKILKTPAVNIDEVTLFLLILEDLRHTAEANQGKCVGIAANQIWKEETPPPAIFIAGLHQVGEWKIFINPKIRGTGKKVKMYESCMSLAGRKPKLKRRDKNVIITYIDPVDLTEKTEKYFSSDARIIQHECDHLKGILI